MEAFPLRPVPTGDGEVDLVRRAQSGDEKAFEALYRRFVGRVYALCLRLAGDRSEAEELVQRAFVKAWEHLASFRGDSALGTWLHRLAVNEFLQERRSAGRRGRYVTTVEDLEALSPQALPARRGVGPDLEQAISHLPEGARLVFVLHDVEGYTHDEIAVMTSIASGTSKAQLHRARKLLREMLR